MPKYLCCPHCEPACRYRDTHEFPCTKDCLPVAQQEDENNV